MIGIIILIFVSSYLFVQVCRLSYKLLYYTFFGFTASVRYTRDLANGKGDDYYVPRYYRKGAYIHDDLERRQKAYQDYIKGEN